MTETFLNKDSEKNVFLFSLFHTTFLLLLILTGFFFGHSDGGGKNLYCNVDGLEIRLPENKVILWEGN